MEVSRRAMLLGLGGTAATAASLGAMAPSAVWAAELSPISSLQGVGVPRGVARLLYNENPLGASPLALQAAAAALPSSNRYPMQGAFGLIEQIHRLHGLPLSLPSGPLEVGKMGAALAESHVLLGTGSTEILRAAALAWGLEGGEIVEVQPGYAEVGAAAQAMLGNRIRRVMVPLVRAEGFRYDTQALGKAVGPATRIVVITNPNNPTGTSLNLADLTRLADRLDPRVLLVVDEAYIDFAETPGVASAVGLATTRPNVLVSRTFSKLHGLAGLRLGYAVASKPVLTRLRPYLMNLLGINSAVLAAASASLADMEYLRQSREVALIARKRMLAELGTVGLRPVAGDAPFVWAALGTDCSALVARLARGGVLIAGGHRWGIADYVRISGGQPAEMDALFGALRTKA